MRRQYLHNSINAPGFSQPNIEKMRENRMKQLIQQEDLRLMQSTPHSLMANHTEIEGFRAISTNKINMPVR